MRLQVWGVLENIKYIHRQIKIKKNLLCERQTLMVLVINNLDFLNNPSEHKTQLIPELV